MSKTTFHAVNLKRIAANIIILLIPSLVGFISSRLTGDSSVVYNSMIKPPLAPPAFIFPIVWIALYLVIGIALLLVCRAPADRGTRREALAYFFAQLFLNFLWPIVFFRLRMPFLAIFIELALWILTGITTVKFYKIKPAAGLLMLPYWLWVTFALYLNVGFWLLNR